MAQAEKTSAKTSRKPGAGDKSETSDPVMIPLCDVAGYSCFVMWAFVIGWDRNIVPVGVAGFDSYFVLRMALFAGVALGACFFFFTGRLTAARTAGWALEGVWSGLCLFPALTFFIPLPFWPAAALWALGGFGQAGVFLMWGARFRALARQQQLYAVCGAFASGGFMLALSPFIDRLIMVPMVALLPIASYILIVFARRQYAGEGDAPAEEKAVSKLCGGKLKDQIPFEEDRRFVILKGLFTLLYSVSLGFVTCAALASWFLPLNEAVIGLSNAVAAFVMIFVLRHREWEREVCNVLPRLFLAVTSVCYLFLGVLWPTSGVLVCAAILFVLFGCYEILNAHTAYAYSNYDIVRCLWELHSSKTGNSVGFFLGWSAATMGLYYFDVDTTALLVVCFLMVSLAVVVDTLLFKRMKLEFREVVVDDGALLEVLDPKIAELSPQGRGRWSRACGDLAETYKLSPRQTEIFLLLAKGRNVQFIKDELVLSTPTVKSHVYNIYQKMGVHSHQELLDLVEKSVKGS